MPIRPQIQEETVDRVNKKLDDVMRIDPEDAGLDTKINILLEELSQAERENAVVERQSAGGRDRL